MKFNKQINNGTLLIPGGAFKISGFEGGEKVEIHTLDSAVVVLKKQMTTMELIQAMDALHRLATELTVHLARVCGTCDDCEDGCPFDDLEDGMLELPDYLREEAGIPAGAKLCVYVDDEEKTVTIAEAGYDHDLREEVPITTPANQYICDCDANRLLVTRTCDDAECTGYTSSGMELNLPAALLSEASIPVGEEVAVLAADGALIIVPSTEELRELSVELCCLLNELGISPLTIPPAGKWRLP